MLKESKNKIENYVQFLKKKLQEEGNSEEYADSLGDSEILDHFRTCCDCGDEVLSLNNVMRAILEWDTPARTFEILCEQIDLDHNINDEEINEDEDEDEDEETCNCDECEPDVELENEEIVRAQWIMDGSETIDEACKSLQDFIIYLEHLKDNGYELVCPIENDWGYLAHLD
jgi:hypothetical protein